MAKEANDEARRAVIQEWGVWSQGKDDPKAMGGMVFFNHLQNERPGLLEFKAGTQDKWQVVHGWLLRARLVDD